MDEKQLIGNRLFNSTAYSSSLHTYSVLLQDTFSVVTITTIIVDGNIIYDSSNRNNKLLLNRIYMFKMYVDVY